MPSSETSPIDRCNRHAASTPQQYLDTPSIMSLPDGPMYEPKDALEITSEHALIVGGFGAVISAIQNTLARQNLGAMGFLTRFGGTTATFSMSVGLRYCDNGHLTMSCSCNGRIVWFHADCRGESPRKRGLMEHGYWRIFCWLYGWPDQYVDLNFTSARYADLLVGRTLPACLGYGALLSVLMGVFDYTGGKLTGYEKDPTVDEIDRKEFLRKNRRRSIWETIAELGEGRGLYLTTGSENCHGLTLAGIYGPGYQERRRERIKQNYGIDVGEDPSKFKDAELPRI